MTLVVFAACFVRFRMEYGLNRQKWRTVLVDLNTLC
uniref:Uncharacterized protein n=1 Tax=Arundo donax TaxID=35708 RepID=A0A0A9BDK0_ARUDO